MYKRILLAYDGSIEGRTALREGALLARQCGAQVFLLSVLVDTATFLLADVAHAGASVQMEDAFADVLNEGVARLKQLGFDPVAKMVRGEPAEEIGAYARQIEADLVVVGHRRQGAFARWWSGPRGAYLMDYTDCSLLVARNVISDEAIEAARLASSQTTE
jgi:nucleotide-binding universal stress UspA family protein